MNAAPSPVLISRPALAGAVLLAALGCATPAQADHGRGGFHAFAFGFAAPYPGPVVSYPAAGYYYYYYYYYPAPQYYYPPPATYYAPPAAYYPPATAAGAPPSTHSSPSTGYLPPPAGYGAPPADDHAPPPAAKNVRPPPAQPTQVAAGKDCHEASHTINIDGQPVSAYGMLCRQPDGSYALSDPYHGSVASSR